ncbi:uncharacterized protein LOC135366183 isoform X2 [Ornithodoros turicata]|uniref:uncharacterized protein LOC135366183 isoform X2 n=1 Tax=Ornithodoros turicata TaxID=34597 RepID=UPI003138FDD4
MEPATAVTRRRNNAWSSEKESELIRFYRMHSLLWDSRHPEYYKRDKRDLAMRAIARALGPDFDVTSVKDKIKTLRDYFVKELKKEEVSRKSAAAAYISRWEHFGSWQFLRSVLASDGGRFMAHYAGNPAGQVKQEAPDTYQVFQCHEEETMILPTIESRDSPPQTHSVRDEQQRRCLTVRPLAQEESRIPAPPHLTRWTLQHAQEQTAVFAVQPHSATFISSAPNIYSQSKPDFMDTTAVQEPTVQQDMGRHDEDDFFCKHVISELRQMSKYQKDLAKLRIQQILFEVKYSSSSAVANTSTPPSSTVNQEPSPSPIPVVGFSSSPHNGNESP